MYAYALSGLLVSFLLSLCLSLLSLKARGRCVSLALEQLGLSTGRIFQLTREPAGASDLALIFFRGRRNGAGRNYKKMASYTLMVAI